MTMLQLQYFKSLAVSLNLVNTAETFFVSPPAIHSSIHRLEEELGVDLFLKTGRRLQLTVFGEVFLHHVNDILSSFEKAKLELKDISASGAQSSISIGVISPILWSNLMTSFMNNYPNIKIKQYLLKEHQLSDPTFCSKFDIIFCNELALHTNHFFSVPLPMDNTPCLVVYPDHPFANKKSIHLWDAKYERFIALSSGYSFRSYFDTMCKLAGFKPNIVLECDFSIRSEMLSAKYGILLTTKSIEECNVFKDASFIEIIEPYYKRTHAIFINKNIAYNEQSHLFMDFVAKYYSISIPTPQ